MLPRASSLDGLLLAEKLRPLVVADHVGECDGSVLVHDGSIGLEAHGGDARRVDNSLDPGLAGQFQQFARTVDVRAIHLPGIAHPQPVICGDVDQRIAACQCGAKIFRLEQVAHDDLGVDAFERIHTACLAGQQSKACTFSRILPRHMTADKARRSRDKYAHSLSFLVELLRLDLDVLLAGGLLLPVLLHPGFEGLARGRIATRRRRAPRSLNRPH